MKLIIVNSIDFKGSIVDGPGIRTVLYLQGCEQKCEGCHNPRTWELNGGKSVPVAELVDEITQKSLNKKLTISGGEPLLQVPAVLELIDQLGDFNITLYTGQELDQVPQELLQVLDYIKVGKYDKKKHCTTVDYIGATNQKFYRLEKGDIYEEQ